MTGSNADFFVTAIVSWAESQADAKAREKDRALAHSRRTDQFLEVLRPEIDAFNARGFVVADTAEAKGLGGAGLPVSLAIHDGALYLEVQGGNPFVVAAPLAHMQDSFSRGSPFERTTFLDHLRADLAKTLGLRCALPKAPAEPPAPVLPRELDKLTAHRQDLQLLQDFFEWMDAHGLSFGHYEGHHFFQGLPGADQNLERLRWRFLEIDPQKIEQERQDLIAQLQQGGAPCGS